MPLWHERLSRHERLSWQILMTDVVFYTMFRLKVCLQTMNMHGYMDLKRHAVLTTQRHFAEVLHSFGVAL